MKSLGFFAKSKYDGNLYNFSKEGVEFFIHWQGDKIKQDEEKYDIIEIFTKN